MHFKKTLVGAALSLSMLPLAARAEHDQAQQYQYPQQDQTYQQQYQYPQQYQQPYEQAPGYQQGPTAQSAEPCPAEPPRGHRRHQGRYELRTVQQWVPARYQQVWVPQQCSVRERQRGWWTQTGYVCVPGHYDQRWVAGHYETAQQWVWVRFDHGRRWGHRRGYDRSF
ncbi:MAG TPA: hypothetical protein VFB81_22275 [Myxococcales bacterium]|nr:hypothetical protein [Myxococcales bacterium]